MASIAAFAKMKGDLILKIKETSMDGDSFPSHRDKNQQELAVLTWILEELTTLQGLVQARGVVPKPPSSRKTKVT